ncbi:alpha/beta hydrolase [Pseudonocardia nigra]|uniref:alpha/beta hydrolase n=1 Tax=Pseudonocardia nigra TaxID=1921578 RepID=UPI001C5EC73B|nr:alpha/beta hydrolase [Pseudonocardia nigra]
MALRPQAQEFLDIVAGAPPLDTQTAEQNREDLVKALPLTGEPTPLPEVRDATLPGPGGPIPVRVYRPGPGPGLPAVVYLHGGGWVLGDLDLCDTTARDVAAHSGAVVVTVDYRLAPEHPWPAAVDDALAVTRALLDGTAGLDTDPGAAAVAGDSAGGNLAAVVAQQLRGSSPGLRHQVLIYPVTTARAGTTPSYAEFADGHFLTRRDMQYFLDTYAGGVDPADPRLAPAAAEDLTGLPAATVVTAECDVLRDEGEAYARRMQAAGVPVALRRFDGQVHPFVYLGGIIDDALVARRFMGERLRAAFALRP